MQVLVSNTAGNNTDLSELMQSLIPIGCQITLFSSGSGSSVEDAKTTFTPKELLFCNNRSGDTSSTVFATELLPFLLETKAPELLWITSHWRLTKDITAALEEQFDVAYFSDPNKPIHSASGIVLVRWNPASSRFIRRWAAVIRLVLEMGNDQLWTGFSSAESFSLFYLLGENVGKNTTFEGCKLVCLDSSFIRHSEQGSGLALESMSFESFQNLKVSEAVSNEELRRKLVSRLDELLGKSLLEQLFPTLSWSSEPQSALKSALLSISKQYLKLSDPARAVDVLSQYPESVDEKLIPFLTRMLCNYRDSGIEAIGLYAADELFYSAESRSLLETMALVSRLKSNLDGAL